MKPSRPARRALAAAGSALTIIAITPARTTAPAIAAPGVATVASVRAAHHSGFDRLLLEFTTAKAPRASVGFVERLIHDASGRTVPVPGRAVLRVVLRDARAHTDSGRVTVDLDQAFALPNIMTLRGAGDFENVVTMGIGLAARKSFHVHRFSNPGRIAIDVATSFSRTTRNVYFLRGQKVVAVRRAVPDAYPATGLLDRVFAGPTESELDRGLRLVRSGTTGFTSVSVASGIARLRLTGGCRASGSTTIADSILPTLRGLRNVNWVKIYYPAGKTQYPTGKRDSLPSCLVPAKATCLYFVKDLTKAGDLYIGTFLALQRTGASVTGSTGEFYSEWFSVRGTITGSTARIERQVESGAWVRMPLTWLPDKGTFKGWTKVTAEQIRRYSGGGVPPSGAACG
jgi:hypothetical protein